MRYRRLLRSLLNGDVLLRVAAVALAAAILARALLSGSSGWQAVVVVLAGAGQGWGVLRLGHRVRTLMSPPKPEADAEAAGDTKTDSAAEIAAEAEAKAVEAAETAAAAKVAAEAAAK